jgi:hypothetical protein
MSQLAHFSHKVATLRDCRDSNLRPLPRAKPPLPLHHTLICIHMQFWLYSYYTTPSANRFFEALNRFKLKTCQLQSFITLWDLQLSWWPFFHLRSFTKFEFQIWEIQIWISLTIWFQIKICKLRNFITSQDIQLSCWEFLHLRPFENFKFSNFKNSDVLYFNKSNSNKNDSTTKFYNFWTWKTFILVICSSRIVVTIFFTNLIHLSHSFFKLYKRYRFCWHNYYHFVKWSNNPNKNCTYCQVMEVWNFVV